MPSPDIFVLSDAVMFAKVLNGVAIMFNPSGGGSSGSELLIGDGNMQIGMIGKIGIVLGMILAVVKSLGEGGRIRIDQVLIGVVAYVALFSPKMQVNIIEIGTGYVESVANVPVGIAMTGVAASWFNTTVAQQFTTVFTPPNGTTSVFDGGLVSPLRLLQGVRMAQSEMTRTGTPLNKSMAQYSTDCVSRRTDVLVTDIMKSNKPVDYFLGTIGGWTPDSGLTISYTDANPIGIPVTCSTSAADIKSRIDTFVAGSGGGTTQLEQFLSYSMERKPGSNGSGLPNTQGVSIADYNAAYNQIIGPAVGISAADFMRSSLFMHALYSGVECGSRNLEAPAYWQCVSQLNQMSAQAATASAASASYFQKTMVFGMNILFLLFFAMSPVIAVVLAVTGFQGIGVVAKYFVFGIWCQSWVPFAVVLNYVIQEQTAYELNRLLSIPQGLTFANFAPVFDVLTTKLALASDLLAMTPLVSMALLSGSMYALSNVAGKWGGQAHADNTSLSPSHLNNGAQNTIKGNDYATQGMDVGGLARGSSSLSVMSSGSAASYGTMTDGTSTDSRIQAAVAATASAANEIRLAKAHQTGLAHQLSETGGSGTSGGIDKTNGYQITQGIGSTILKKWGIDKGASEGMTHKLGVAAAMYAEGNTSGALQYARDSGLSKELAEHRAKNTRTGVGGGGRVGMSEDDQLANDFKTTFSTGTSGTGDNRKMFNAIKGETAKLSNTSMHQLMGQYTQAVSDTQTATNSHAAAVRREQSLTGSTGGGTTRGMSTNQPIVEFANKVSGGENGNVKALDTANNVKDAVTAHLRASAATPAEGQALASAYASLAKAETKRALDDGAAVEAAPLIGALSAARKLSQYTPAGTSQTGQAAAMDAPAIAGLAANSSSGNLAPAPMPSLAGATKALAPVADAAPPVNPGAGPTAPDGWDNNQGKNVVPKTRATINAGANGSSEAAHKAREAAVEARGEANKKEMNLAGVPTDAEGETGRQAADSGVQQGQKRLDESTAQTLLKGTPQGGVYVGAGAIIGAAALRTALSGVGEKAASALIDHATGGGPGGGGHKPSLPGGGSPPKLPGPPSSGAGSGASRAAFKTAFSNGMSKLATKLATRAVPGAGWAATAMDIADAAQGIHSVLQAQGYTNISPETIKDALVQGARASGWNVWEGDQGPSHTHAPPTMPNNIPTNPRRK